MTRIAAARMAALAGREPADPQAGEAVALRQHADRDDVVAQIGAGLETVGRDRARAAGRPRRRAASPRRRRPGRRARSTTSGAGSMPVGLCGALTTIRRVAGRSAARIASRSIAQPSSACSSMVGHVGAGAAGDLVQRLVARPGGDHVVAGPDEPGHEAGDRLAGAGERDDVVGVDRVVQRGQLGPQQRVAGRLGVAEPQVVPERGRSRRRRWPPARASRSSRDRTSRAGTASRTRARRSSARGGTARSRAHRTRAPSSMRIPCRCAIISFEK